MGVIGVIVSPSALVWLGIAVIVGGWFGGMKIELPVCPLAAVPTIAPSANIPVSIAAKDRRFLQNGFLDAELERGRDRAKRNESLFGRRRTYIIYVFGKNPPNLMCKTAQVLTRGQLFQAGLALVTKVISPAKLTS